MTAWKNEIVEKHLYPKYSKKLSLPESMVLGLYNYIVFEPIEKSTGKVYYRLCHKIMKQKDHFPNSEM